MPSSSAKQSRFMAAIAHSPSFAKKVGVSQSVGKDFNAADKGKTFARGGVTQQKINKQNTRHGMMDLPVANLSRFSGMKKGGIMKKRRFDEGGDVDMENAGYDKSGEGEDAVYRKSFATGVTASNETPAPKKAAVKPMMAEDYDRGETALRTAQSSARANSPTRNLDSAGSSTVSPAQEAVLRTREMDKENSSQNARELARTADDTRGVSGRASRKYVSKLTDQQKSDNADRFAKEAVLTAVTGGAGALARGAIQAARAAKLRDMPMRDLLKMRNKEGFQGHKSGGKIAGFKKGGAVMKESKGMMGKEVAFMKKKGAPASMIKHEKAEMGMKRGGMMKYAEGGMTMVEKGGKMVPDFAADGKGKMKMGGMAGMKKMMGGGMAKYAKGGGIESRGKTKGTIIRMASGGSVSSASRRADGIAQRGKTRC